MTRCHGQKSRFTVILLNLACNFHVGVHPAGLFWCGWGRNWVTKVPNPPEDQLFSCRCFWSFNGHFWSRAMFMKEWEAKWARHFILTDFTNEVSAFKTATHFWNMLFNNNNDNEILIKCKPLIKVIYTTARHTIHENKKIAFKLGQYNKT